MRHSIRIRTWKWLSCMGIALALLVHSAPSHALAPQSEFAALQREREQLENADLGALDGEGLIRWYSRLAYLTHAMTGRKRADILHEISKRILAAVAAGKIDTRLYHSYFFAFDPSFSLAGPAVLIPQLPSPFENDDGSFLRLEGASENDLWRLIKYRQVPGRPMLTGITGGPGSGKSHTSRNLAHISRSKGSKGRLLGLDHYMLAKAIRESRGIRRGIGKYDVPRIARDAQSIVHGRPFVPPLYDIELARPVDDVEHPVDPAELQNIFIEGEFALLVGELEDRWDVRVYVDEMDFLRYVQECMRDLRTRNRDPMDTTWIFITSQVPDYMDLVRKQIKKADIVYRPSEKEIWYRKDYHAALARKTEKTPQSGKEITATADALLSGQMPPNFWLGGRGSRLYKALEIKAEISVRSPEDFATLLEQMRAQQGIGEEDIVLLAHHSEPRFQEDREDNFKRVHLVGAKLKDLIEPQVQEALKANHFIHRDWFLDDATTPLEFEHCLAVDTSLQLLYSEGLYLDPSMRRYTRGLMHEFQELQRAIREAYFPGFDIRTIAGNLSTMRRYLDHYDADFYYGVPQKEIMPTEDLAFVRSLQLLDDTTLEQTMEIVVKEEREFPYKTLYLMLRDQWAEKGRGNALRGVLEHLEKLAESRGRDAVNDLLLRFSGLEIRGRIGTTAAGITPSSELDITKRLEQAA